MSNQLSAEHAVRLDASIAQVKAAHCEALKTKLIARIVSQQHLWRSNQTRGMQNLVQLVRGGDLEGLIKQPPGAGKTRWFSEAVAAIEEPALILIPKKANRARTQSTLIEVGLPEEQIHMLRPRAGATVTQLVEQVLSRRQGQQDPWALGYTYSAHLSLLRHSPELFNRLVDAVGIIINDEAHWSVGIKTKSSILAGARVQLTEALSAALHTFHHKREEFIGRLDSRLRTVRPQDSQEADLENLAIRTLCEVAMEAPWRQLPADARSHRLERVSALFAEGIKEVREIESAAGAQPLELGPKSFANTRQLALALSLELERNCGTLVERHLDAIMAESQRPHLQIFATATPQLTFKRVEREFNIPVIDSTRVQEMIDEGISIMPTHVTFGTAVHRSEQTKLRVTNKLIRELCENDRFVMEDGRSVLEAGCDAYVEERERQGGYLPGVVYCASIAQAEAAAIYLRSKGLNVARCTSGNAKFPPGLDPDDAQAALEKLPGDPNRLDAVTTVAQVGEGWDVRPLHAAVWLTIVHSPKKSLQNNGRIMRSLIEGDLWPIKHTGNTFIFEPVWKIGAMRIGFSGGEALRDEDRPESPPGSPPGTSAIPEEDAIYVSTNAIEMMVSLGELDVSYVLRKGVSLRRIVFNPHDPDHARTLIGSVQNLLQDGFPRDLHGIQFANGELRWKAAGTKLQRALCPEIPEGHDACAWLARMLWPREAGAAIFDAQNDDHLRALIGSPAALLHEMKPVGNLNQLEFTCAERGWRVSGRYLSSCIAPQTGAGEAEVSTLLDQLWPITVKDDGLNYADESQLRKLAPFDALMQPDAIAQDFTAPDEIWIVSGRHLFAKVNVSSNARLAGRALARMLYPEQFEAALRAQQDLPEELPPWERPDALMHEGILTKQPKTGNKKGDLFERCTKLGLPSPVFTTVATLDESGESGSTVPRHSKIHVIECRVGAMATYARATNIKWGQHAAARIMLRDGLSQQAVFEAEIPSGGNPLKLLKDACASQHLPAPSYRVIAKSGPQHDLRHTVECKVGDVATTGQGKRAKDGEAVAAGTMLEKLREKGMLPPDSGSEVTGASEDEAVHTRHELAEINFTQQLFDFSRMHGLSGCKYTQLAPRDTEAGKMPRVLCQVGDRRHIACGTSYQIARQFAARGMHQLLLAEVPSDGLKHISAERIHKRGPARDSVAALERRCEFDPDIPAGLLTYQTVKHANCTEVICSIGSRSASSYGANRALAQQWAAEKMLQSLPPIQAGDTRGKNDRLELVQFGVKFLQLAQSAPTEALQGFCAKYYSSSRPQLATTPVGVGYQHCVLSLDVGEETVSVESNVKESAVTHAQGKLAFELLRELIRRGPPPA